ncbi:MAG: hypothetical protein IKM55_03250 [Bacilli bacterium]|nr:hypothetical protein [Bacilli bacterium]
MNKNMMDLYKKLDVNTQREELSSLLIKIDMLLNGAVQHEELKDITNVKNYNCSDEQNINMTESEMLTFIYEDLWNIKNKILLILSEHNK